MMRDLAKIAKPWARDAVAKVRSATGGQVKVFERLCPKCNPEKVVTFMNKEKL